MPDSDSPHTQHPDDPNEVLERVYTELADLKLSVADASRGASDNAAADEAA